MHAVRPSSYCVFSRNCLACLFSGVFLLFFMDLCGSDNVNWVHMKVAFAFDPEREAINTTTRMARTVGRYHFFLVCTLALPISVNRFFSGTPTAWYVLRRIWPEQSKDAFRCSLLSSKYLQCRYRNMYAFVQVLRPCATFCMSFVLFSTARPQDATTQSDRLRRPGPLMRKSS